MNKLKFFAVSLVTFLLLSTTAHAAGTCNYEEKAKLNSEVANVKTNFEIKQETIELSPEEAPDEYYGTSMADNLSIKEDYIQINILNLTENLYVEVTNDLNKEKQTYKYSDSDNGNVAIIRKDLDKIVTYTIKIFASSNTGCEGTALSTKYVAVPRYNDYSEYSLCSQVPEYFACERYVTFEEIDFSKFIEQVTKEIENKNKQAEEEKENGKWYNEVGNFISENKVYFIVGGVALVVIAGVVTVVIIKRRRRSVI